MTLSSGEVLIARVARRFMPRLKVESEVATLAYLRAHTRIPVPVVYAWDSNPYNRLGGEWILMSRVSVCQSSIYPSIIVNTWDVMRLLRSACICLLMQCSAFGDAGRG